MIEQLAKQIEHHNDLYWLKNAPEISDEAYDLLVAELKRLDPEHRLVTRLPAAPRGKIRHLRPMLSLDKAYTGEEVLAWAKGVARGPDELFRVAFKWDGCSIECQGNGIVATRGDGEYGEDASHIANWVSGGLDYGEVIVLKSVFERLKPRRPSGEPYKNTRAAAAGILANPKADASLITFRPFDHDCEFIKFSEIAEIDWDAALEEGKKRDEPVDGIVISLFDEAYGASLGMTEHHPRHSIALKCKNPAGVTELLGVEFQNGKHRITLVGIVAPVEISGSITERVTLHNLDFIHGLGLRIGSTVKLAKMGDVIPGIEEVLEQGDGAVITCTACPACGNIPAIRGQDYVCENPHCPGTLAARLLDSVNRVGIETVGPGVARALVDARKTHLNMLFEMTAKDWFAIEGFAEVSARSMYNRFQAVKLAPLEDYKVLAAMNIEGVGLSLSKTICSKVSIYELLTTDLTALDGIGPTRASQIVRQWDHAWWGYAQMNLNITATKGLADRPTVCFTGADPDGVSRDELAKLAEKAGYTYAGAVTKKLSVLVAARTDTTKAKKAASYGTKVITYQEFKGELS